LGLAVEISGISHSVPYKHCTSGFHHYGLRWSVDVINVAIVTGGSGVVEGVVVAV